MARKVTASKARQPKRDALRNPFARGVREPPPTVAFEAEAAGVPRSVVSACSEAWQGVRSAGARFGLYVAAAQRVAEHEARIASRDEPTVAFPRSVVSACSVAWQGVRSAGARFGLYVAAAQRVTEHEARIASRDEIIDGPTSDWTTWIPPHQ